jgi:hypothetical protein
MGPGGGALPDARVELRGITTQPVSFHGQPRIDVVMPRTAIHLDHQGICRFVADISWDAQGGREQREVVVMLGS